MPDEPADSDNLLGAFIRAQRQMANLSLRELAAMTEISNPYLSQIERGLSEPSARVLKSIAEALNLSAEAMFAQAGLMSGSRPRDDDATESAIRTDPRLSEAQKRALLAVYRSYIAGSHEEANGADGI
jgi:transcriptional regulator with XRE-family HTH domain